jgi:hypothetical protein
MMIVLSMDILVTGIKWLLAFSLFFVAMMYFAAPLFIWRLQRSPATYQFLKLSDNSILNMISPQCEQWDKSFRQLHFHYAGTASMMMGQSQTFFSVYRLGDLMAMIIAVKGSTRSAIYAEVSAIRSDDCVINVNNTSVISIFPASARKQTYYYPALQSMPELVSLAKKIIQKESQNNSLKKIDAGKEFEMLEWFLVRESEALVQRGWYRDEVIDGYRKLTLRGAYLMSWRLLWPMRHIVQRRARTESEQLRRELEK